MKCPICGEEMKQETRLNMITYKTVEIEYCINSHFCIKGSTFVMPALRWTGEIVESEIDEENEDEDDDEVEPHYQTEYERDNPRDNIIEKETNWI